MNPTEIPPQLKEYCEFLDKVLEVNPITDPKIVFLTSLPLNVQQAIIASELPNIVGMAYRAKTLEESQAYLRSAFLIVANLKTAFVEAWKISRASRDEYNDRATSSHAE